MEKFTKKNHTANFTVETFACPSCTCSCNGCSCSSCSGVDQTTQIQIFSGSSSSSRNNDTSGGRQNQTF